MLWIEGTDQWNVRATKINEYQWQHCFMSLYKTDIISLKGTGIGYRLYKDEKTNIFKEDMEITLNILKSRKTPPVSNKLIKYIACE